MRSFVLEPDTPTVHGYFSREYPAVLTIDPGDTVVFGTLDAWWSAGPFAGGNVRERRGSSSTSRAPGTR